MNKKTIRDIDVSGKRALVRVDFNVPLDGARISDDTRIRASLPTIEFLCDRDARVILMSHLGRPKGVDEKLRLAPCAVRALQPGEVILLENLRFHKEEEQNDPGFAVELAKLGEIYVNDAFGSAHRAHASTEGVAHLLPGVAGLLMEQELSFLGQAMGSPQRPFIAILGGAKVSDKIAVIENLMQRADHVLIGGGMANTFAKAHGYEMGDSLVENDKLEVARQLISASGGRLVFPVDAVIADRFDKDARSQVVALEHIPPGWRMLDIGPQTVLLFKSYVQDARTIVWNGPLGVFEFPRFAQGTIALAHALANSHATTIIGGGDSIAAVKKAGIADRITHISTGGGASLEYLEGKTLPGVAVLEND